MFQTIKSIGYLSGKNNLSGRVDVEEWRASVWMDGDRFGCSAFGFYHQFINFIFLLKMWRAFISVPFNVKNDLTAVLSRL